MLVAIAALADFRAPAGERYAIRGDNGASILPGGRVIQPLGQQLPTGPGPFGMAVSPNGKVVVTANRGPEESSLTVLRQDRTGSWTLQNLHTQRLPNEEHDLHVVFGGIALANPKQVWLSEGESGSVRLVDLETGTIRKTLNLNGGEFRNSFSGDLAFDGARNILYVVDQAHLRVVLFDAKRDVQISEVSTGYLPYSISLSPDGQHVWVSGDPGVRASSSVCELEVSQPDKPRFLGFVATGVPLGPGSAGDGLSRVLATAKAVYVSNAHDDTIDVLDPETRAVRAVIPLRIPGLEQLRGILPLGLALDESHDRLLVAEAGINAVGVIDLKLNKVAAHLPVGWFPTAVVVRDGLVFVANANGRGTGPSSVVIQPDYLDFGNVFRRGSVSVFPMPESAEFAKRTQLVLAANGLLPIRDQPAPKPPIRYVVVIVKGNRTFDEVLGDVTVAGAKVEGSPRLARFGASGYADGRKVRFSLNNVNVTPNEHALAHRFSFSDNFYADSDVSIDGHHWVLGADPKKQEQAGNTWQHLERSNVSFRNFGEGFEGARSGDGEGEKSVSAGLSTTTPVPDALFRNTSREYPAFDMNIPDQFRAAEFIAEIDRLYAKAGQALPHLLFLHLPNDHTSAVRPTEGYPYSASYVADNDVALGKIVDYLSHSAWWREMAIFVTEDAAQTGKDHVDSHRTVLLGIGPYFKRGYASHMNGSFPSLLKTVFRLLGMQPLNLFDASASNLMDMMTDQPDFDPYSWVTTDPVLFDPASVMKPSDPKPSIR